MYKLKLWDSIEGYDEISRETTLFPNKVIKTVKFQRWKRLERYIDKKCKKYDFYSIEW